jgi:hypothetical protein
MSSEDDVKIARSKCVARVWTGFISFRIGLNGARFQMRCRNSGFCRRKQFIDQLRERHLLQEDSAPWSCVELV